MLVFITPKLDTTRIPYSYRSRARLVGKCITHVGQANKNDIVVLGRIHNEFHVEQLRDYGIRYIHDICDNKSYFSFVACSGFMYRIFEIHMTSGRVDIS